MNCSSNSLSIESKWSSISNCRVKDFFTFYSLQTMAFAFPQKPNLLVFQKRFLHTIPFPPLFLQNFQINLQSFSQFQELIFEANSFRISHLKILNPNVYLTWTFLNTFLTHALVATVKSFFNFAILVYTLNCTTLPQYTATPANNHL